MQLRKQHVCVLNGSVDCGCGGCTSACREGHRCGLAKPAAVVPSVNPDRRITVAYRTAHGAVPTAQKHGHSFHDRNCVERGDHFCVRGLHQAYEGDRVCCGRCYRPYRCRRTWVTRCLGRVQVLGLIFGIEDGVKIAEHFPVPKNETDDCRLTAAKVATQGLFVCSTRNVSLIVSGGQSHPVHVYHYDHLMSFRKLIWGSNFTICDTEVCHGAELVPLFHPNVSSFNVTYTPQEQVLSSSMDTFWTNVAKTGSPGSYGSCRVCDTGCAEPALMLLLRQAAWPSRPSIHPRSTQCYSRRRLTS